MVGLQWAWLPRDNEIDRIAESLHDDKVRAVLLVGPRGVGRSYLLDQSAARADARHHLVHRVAGSVATMDVPFAALAHLLPPGTSTLDAAGVIAVLGDRWRAGRRLPAAPALGRVSGGRRSSNGGDDSRVLVAVDDLHLVDSASLAALTQMVSNHDATLFGTVCSDSDWEPGLRALAGERHVRLIPVDPLDRAAARRLTELVLAGPADDQLHDEIWTASLGNPQMLRQLVLGALAESRWRRSYGEWHTAGPWTDTAPVVALVEDRVRTLRPSARRAIELVALAEPLDLVIARQLIGDGGLAELEQLGAVTADDTGNRITVRCAPPIISSAVRALVPLLRRHLLVEQLIEAFEQAPPAAANGLRIAAWRLEVGEPIQPDVAAPAVLRALQRYDVELAKQLSRYVPRPASGEMALAEAFIMLVAGRAQEARECLARARTTAGTAEEAEFALACQVAALCWWCSRADEAHLVIDEALESQQRWPAPDDLTSPIDVAGIRGLRAQVLLFEGRLPEAAAEADDALAIAGRGSAAWVRASATRALLFAHDADIELAEAYADAALSACEPHAKLDPGAPIQAVSALALARLGRGDADGARQLLSNGLNHLGPTRTDVTSLPWRWHLVDLLGWCGHPLSALRCLREGLVLNDHYGEALAVSLSQLLQATNEARAGQIDAARLTLADLERRNPSHDPRLIQLAQDTATASIAAAEGDREGAARARIRHATRERSAGNSLIEALALLEAAILGQPQVARTRQMAAERSSPLLDAVAATSTAISTGDTGELLDIAATFAGMGAPAVAAELAAAAAIELAGQGRSAGTATALCEEYEGRCESLTPSPLGRITAQSATARLSRREREIAALAASGLTNRDIAERLGVSPRTVENHLYKAFTKLGVTRRSKLASIFHD